MFIIRLVDFCLLDCFSVGGYPIGAFRVLRKETRRRFTSDQGSYSRLRLEKRENFSMVGLVLSMEIETSCSFFEGRMKHMWDLNSVPSIPEEIALPLSFFLYSILYFLIH